jgi:hypothetical protein
MRLRHSRSGRLAAATLGALLLIPVGTEVARADTTIADEYAPTRVSADRGRIVWSSFDPATGEHRLMTRTGAGATEQVPVPPSPTPFEADLGPGPGGGPVAVYARCRPGCDVFMFDFATGRERRVPGAASAAYSESAPTVWRDRVAFARVRGARQRVPRIRLVSLTRPRRARTLPGGSRACLRARFGPCRRILVGDLELSGRRLAILWIHDIGEIRRFEMLSGRLGRRPGILARTSHGALSSSAFFDPGYAGAHLYFGFSRSGSGPSTSRFVRARLDTGALEDAEAPFRLVGFARDGASTYYAMAEGEVGCFPEPAQPPRCHVRAADPPVFRPYQRTRFGPGYQPPR